jgi:hypothetical protein
VYGLVFSASEDTVSRIHQFDAIGKHETAV